MKIVRRLKGDRKAVFFSLMSLFMVLMLVLNFRVASMAGLDQNKVTAQNTRIKIMNDVVYDLEERYLERMIFVSGKASLFALSDNKDKITDLSDDFESMLFYGNFSSSYANSEIYNNHSISILADDLQNKFKGIGLEIDKMEVRAELSQNDPWYVHIDALIDYELNDAENLAGWRGRIKKSVDVDVYGFYTDEGRITDSWKKSDECDPDECSVSFLGRLDPDLIGGNGICKTC